MACGLVWGRKAKPTRWSSRRKRRPGTIWWPAAFAIPYGALFSEKQRAEYERLKADKEPALREAVAALAAADTPAEKANCSREVNALTRRIRAGIQQIVLMPYHEALQARQLQAMEQSQSSYSSSGYSGNYDPTAVNPYGYYYGPYYGYGYPWYVGWPEWYAWRRHHHHHHGNTLAGQQAGYSAGTTTRQQAGKTTGTSAATHAAASTVKASGTQVVRYSTAGASTKPSSTAKPAARPTTQPQAHSHPAKHH